MCVCVYDAYAPIGIKAVIKVALPITGGEVNYTINDV